MTDAPAIILVRPQMGENIGAAARAMLNFGLGHMRVVDPRDGWPNERAVANASGAGRVLDAAMLAGDVAQATGDLHTLYATTARTRELTKPVLSPEQAMRDAHARIARGERVGILFGPERAGLETADLVPAQALISVPVNPEFPSLNLAQCVLLTAYEWARATGAPTPLAPGKSRPATRAEVAHLTETLKARLDDARFFFPEHKRASMIDHLDNLFLRRDWTDAEIRTLYGVIRALAKGAPAGPAED